MKRVLKEVFKNQFFKNVMIMVTGTAAAQLVGLIMQPLITRIYGPEIYGLMGIFLAIVGLLIPISTLTYAISIVLPKSDQEAKGLIQLSIYISTGISIFIAGVLLFFNQSVIEILSLENMEPYLYLIPLTVFFAGVMQVTEQWSIRKNYFSINAKVKFIHSLLFNGSKVSVGVFFPTASTLIIISSLRDGIKALLMIVFIKKNRTGNKIPGKSLLDWYSLKEIIKKYKDFPIFRAPQVFLFSVSQSLPVLILTVLFGAASAGYFTLGRTVLIAPSSLLAKSVGDVFYPRIAEAKNSGEKLTVLIRKASLSLIVVGCIPFGVIMIFGPELFSVVFGEAWYGAGEYARWMALGMFFEFINKPCVNSLAVMSAQGFHLKYTIFELAIRIASLLLGYYFWANEIIAVALYGISGAVLNMILMIITFRISGRHDKS